MTTAAQQAQAPAQQQINPNSLLNAISAQRDQALNALAFSEARVQDLSQAIQQAAGELDTLKASAVTDAATIADLKAQLEKLQGSPAADAPLPAVDAAAMPQAAV